MKITELMEYLDEVYDKHGDADVRATCDGWAPSEIAILRNKDNNGIMLYGVRNVDRMSGNRNRGNRMELINDE